MLKRVGGEINPEGAVTTIGEAEFPVPFPPGLEFNSPAHGNWNIVHTGMLMPEAIQIYVCADNCMRGVVLTAAEMNAADRFSFVIIEEENLLNGNLEDVTIEGVTDVLNKTRRKTKSGTYFLQYVCIIFWDVIWTGYTKNWKHRFPEIVFVRCFMDPIMQKHGLTPDQKLRKALYDPLEKRSSDEKVVTLVGNDFALDETCDIKRLLRSGGYTLKELTACTNWEEYQELGSGKMLISCYPPAKYGAEMLAERLQRTHLYLPGSFDYEEIKEEIRTFAEAVKNSVSNVEKNDKGAILRNTENSMSFEDLEAFFQQEIVLCEDALKHAKSIIGRYSDRVGLSLSSETARTGKTSSYT